MVTQDQLLERAITRARARLAEYLVAPEGQRLAALADHQEAEHAVHAEMLYQHQKALGEALIEVAREIERENNK